MKLIAITGGIGAGKSTVSQIFGGLGANVISADAVSREIMLKGEAAYNETVKCFGSEILRDDGEIDRRTLADIVFADEEKLKTLNNITHKYIYEGIKRKISDSAEVNCLEIPLLFSAKCPIEIDLSIAVVADTEVRIERIMKRDACGRDEAVRRMNNQLSDDVLREKADLVIENNGNSEHLRKCAEKIFSSLMSDCGTE